MTTNRIADLAGISIGSLYQYFPNKDAILVALVREIRREMLNDLKQAEQAAEDVSLPEAVGLLVRAAIAHHVRQPLRTQKLEEIENGFDLDSETQELKCAINDIAVRLLTSHGVENAGVAAFDLAAIVRGMADAAVLNGERDFADLALRITRAALGYLGLNSH